MTSTNTTLTEKSSNTPLDRLQKLMAEDLKSTNDLIIEQLQSDVSIIPKIGHYIIAAGGKRIRPLLTLASAKMFEGDMTKAHFLAAAVEFIHTATLLHDDVVDESEQRRGQLTSNLVFGNQASVLVGDFLFARSFELMVKTDSIQALKMLSNASATITEGEVKQLSTRREIDTSLQDYFEVINGKTAALFAAACSVGSIIADQDEKTQTAMYNYGQNLGMAFQIADDVLDYSANEQKLGKSIGDDFREGKMTLPAILAVKAADKEERLFWADVIENPEEIEPEDFPHAQNLMVRHGVYDQALKIAEEHSKRAMESISEIPTNPIKVTLEEILDYCVKRMY